MKKILALSILPFFFLSGHAADRCKVLPTLEAYMLRDHGDPSRTVWPPIPKDGPECEKLRRDRNAYLCQLPRAEDRASSLHRSLLRLRPSLKSAQKANPAHIGGPAAKARSVAGLSKLLLEREREQLAVQAELAQSTLLLQEVERKLESLDCRFAKRKPWE